jgi:predicted helicase
MDTGKAFEKEVKNCLETELYEGILGINPQLAKVFLNKSYYSNSRKKPIKTDVPLELYVQRADEPYFIWIWECKDYQNKVPVDDIEEFHAKLEQIGLHKTKGTIACRNGFQSSAINYAKDKSISLARILPNGTIIRCTMDLSTVPTESVVFALTHEGTQSLGSMFYGISSIGKGVERIKEFIELEIDRGN